MATGGTLPPRRQESAPPADSHHTPSPEAGEPRNHWSFEYLAPSGTGIDTVPQDRKITPKGVLQAKFASLERRGVEALEASVQRMTQRSRAALAAFDGMKAVALRSAASDVRNRGVT